MYPNSHGKLFNSNIMQLLGKNNKNIDRDELINFIINENYRDRNYCEDSSSSTEDYDICMNPTCDHSINTKIKIKMPQKEPNDITLDDLINLGKSYHCKTNTDYYGIDLAILCRLVSPLSDLNKLIGMKKVKLNIINHIIYFLQKFDDYKACGNCEACIYGKECIADNDDMLHVAITGPPGVGKTELGRIIGRIYKAMGILAKGHMRIARRTDLIAKYLGQTAIKTQKFIDQCSGGVMFIDEVYSLGNAEKRDSFAKECIDTINQNLTDNKKDFLCIIAGYKDSIDSCFFAYNEGLESRFPFRYDIEGYDGKELMEIFLIKIKKIRWDIDVELDLLQKFFEDKLNYFPYFGRDVETMLLNCKIYHSKRMLFQNKDKKMVFNMQDVENGFINYSINREVEEKVNKDKIPHSVRMMYM